MMHTPHGVVKVDISADGITLTVPPAALTVCTRCPDLHVLLSSDGTAARLRTFAAAFLDLADRLDEQEAVR
jgi:hypothetical protein